MNSTGLWVIKQNNNNNNNNKVNFIQLPYFIYYLYLVLDRKISFLSSANCVLYKTCLRIYLL